MAAAAPAAIQRARFDVLPAAGSSAGASCRELDLFAAGVRRALFFADDLLRLRAKVCPF
jgi:hypothetical protein